MDTFLPVRTVELLLVACALLGASGALAALCRLVSPASRPGGIARALLASLGDAVMVVDGEDRIVEANDRAARLVGGTPADLVGRELSRLGPDLPILARGLARGPSAGLVSLQVTGGRIRARAALALVSRRPRRSIVALRVEPERPPPLPPPLPRRPLAAPEAGDPVEARAGLAAAAAAAREPLARATRAASLLRLVAPPLEARAAAALAALEEALGDAERRTGALAAAAQIGARRGVDLAALVEDVAGAAALPPGVRVRADLRPARALADDRALRVALREVLRSVASSLGAGAELRVAVRVAAGTPVVELASRGEASAFAAALARALLAPHGARVEEERVDAGWRLRVALPAAPAEALAPA